tara:strand:+ start:1454 stop:2761 length:1308 start_codon:yes stop_codon:yes gene_type:complete
MFDTIIRLSFYFALMILIFLLGYFSHKYKAKKIFQTVEPVISFFEKKLNKDFDKILGERKNDIFSFKTSEINDSNFSLNNKPSSKFGYFLFLKLDKNIPVLMNDPNNIVWKWNLDKFRNPNKLIPYKLFDNGDIILGKYETKGLYRLDKNGKIIWSKDYYNHHWISNDDKYLYVPGTIFLDNKKDLDNKIYDNSFIKNCEASHKSRFGTVMIIDKDNGNLIKEISLIESFYKSVSSRNIIEKFADNCMDTLHLNDARVLDDNKANHFINGKKGDILVSLRHLNMIALLDGITHDIKWYVQGKFSNQHSPRITKRGTLLVFDNYYENKRSRIVEIDIKSKEILGFYSGKNKNFFSNTRGRIQLLDDKIFIQSSDQGEIFQIICNSKFLNNETCSSKYLFSGVFSGFYPNTGFSVNGEYIKDQIYIGDFYKNLKFLN